MLRHLVTVFVCTVVAIVTSPLSRAQAPPPPTAAIHGIGDLPNAAGAGPVGSAVRDATRVNGVIYAVGASVVNNTTTNGTRLDTPVLWTSTGGSGGTPLLQALPYGTSVSNTQTTDRTAYAITPSAGHIASQAQFVNSGAGTRWVRVDRNLLTAADPTTANLDISSVGGVPVAFAALAISDSGSVLYGQGTDPVDPAAPVGTLATRTPRRYDSLLGINAIDISATGKTWGVPIPRGTSDDGLIMVGAASDGAITGVNNSEGPFGYLVHRTNTTAFRYMHSAGTTTPLDKLSTAGNAWNFPIALSSNGAVTVLAGNSDDYPNGEIYLMDASNAITRLGSPNTGMTPRILGGRSADGAIVVTFHVNSSQNFGQIGGLGIPTSPRLPYVYNGQGWFLLGSILRAQGLDLEALGWNPTDMAVTGVRTVDNADLVFGQGMRRTFDPATGIFTNGALEGFVIELPAGALASFVEPTDAPSDQSLVGAWTGASATPGLVAVYVADGRYVAFTQGTGQYQNGLDRGRYSWAGNFGEFYLTTRHDSNSTFGQPVLNVVRGRFLGVTGDVYRIANTDCDPLSITTQCLGLDSLRVVGDASSIVGAWSGAIPSGPYAGTVITAVFLSESQGLRYFIDYDIPTGQDDSEFGTYTFDSDADTLTLVRASNPGDPDTSSAVLSRDGLALDASDNGVIFPLTRVVQRSTVVPVLTTPLAANGTFGLPFTLTIPAAYTRTFSSTTLPGGLSLDPNTGVISGTPTAAGTFVVDVTGTNTFGDSAQAQVTLTIATATTTTSLASSSNPSAPGQTGNIIATVMGQYGGAVTGTVTFTKGQQVLGMSAVQPDGTATLPLSTLGTGSTVVTAVYGGDANNITSTSPPFTQNVVAPAAATTTTLASTLNPSIVGQSVTLTATVTSGTAGAITGAVDFRRGQTVLFTAPLVNGQAIYATTTLPLGSSGLTAIYSGDAQYITSTSSVLTQIVTMATTTTTLVSSPNPSNGGALVTLAATIASGSTPGAMTGTVTFKRGPTILGTVSVSGNQVSMTTTSLPTGSSNLTAVYSGDATYTGSTSAAVAHTVNRGVTTTMLTSDLNPSTFGTTVTFTASVTSSLGTVPTGDVEFVEGGTTLGMAPLVNGTATFQFSTLSLKNGKTATHNIKAKYLGDAYNASSTSATLPQVVNP